MEYIGSSDGYSVFRNNDGLLEGHKSVGSILLDTAGNQTAKDIERVVTTAKTMAEFTKQIANMNIKLKKKHYNPYRDKNQPTLPFEEQVVKQKKRGKKK